MGKQVKGWTPPADDEIVEPVEQEVAVSNKTPLTSSEEKKFQKWKANLPENLQQDTEDYDLRGAWKAGLQPDDEGHLPSRDPNTGLILKSSKHPTFKKTVEGEEKAGYELYQQDGRYYSRKKQWTPPEEDEVIGPVKKKEQPQPSTDLGPLDFRKQVSQVGMPSGSPSEKSTGKVQNPLVTLKRKGEDVLLYQIPASLVSAGAAGLGGIESLVKSPEKSLKGQLPVNYSEKAQKEIDAINSKVNAAFAKAIQYGSQGKLTEANKKTLLDFVAEANTRKNFLAKYNPSYDKSKIKEWQKGMMTWAVDRSIKGGEISQDLVNRLSEVNDPIDAINWVVGTLVESGVQIPATIATYGASAVGQEIGSIYMDGIIQISKEKGISPQQVIERGLDSPAAALTFGSMAGVLDLIGAKGALSGISKADLTKSLRQRSLQHLKELGKAGATESGTELSQTVLEQVGSNITTGNKKIDLEEVAEAAAKGFVGGGGVHSIAKAITPSPKQRAQTVEEVIKSVSETVDSNDLSSAEKAAEAIDAKINQQEPVTSIETEGTAQVTQPGGTTITDVVPTTTEENAEVIREDQTAVPEQGEIREGLQEDSGRDVQQSPQPEPRTEVAQTEQQAQVETTEQQSEIISRIERLDPNESQGYGVDRNTSLKEEMIENPERAQLAFELMDFAGKVWGEEFSTAFQEKPMASLHQFYYGDANSLEEFVDIQIQSENVSIQNNKQHIEDLQSKKKLTKTDKKQIDFYSDSIKSSEEKIQKIEGEYDKVKKDQQKPINQATPEASEAIGPIPESTETPAAENISAETVSAEPSESLPPPSTPPAIPTIPQEQPASKERKFARQILEDPNISEEVKIGLSEDAKTYIPKSVSVSDADAKAIIESKGVEQSISDYMDRSNGMTNDVRVTLGENLLRKLNQDGDIENAVKVADNLAQFFTDLGRAVNAAKVFQMLSPEGVLRYVTKEITKSKDKYSRRTAERRKKAKEAIDDINKEAVEKILKDPKIKKKIDTEVKKGAIKKAIDFLDTLKIDTKGKALEATYGLTAAAWNTLITTVQKGLQAGLTISQAINKAVAKSKDNKGFDEKGARSFLEDKLKGYQVSLDPEKAIKEELKNQGQTINDVIRKHYTEVEAKKRSLIDKLVKDAGLDQEQAEEIAKDLSNEFDRITKEAKEKALKRYLPKPATKKRASGKKPLTDEIIEASNLGALSEEQYRDMISEKIGVESLTEEQAQKLMDLADKVQKAKEGFDRNNATERMLNYVAKIEGISWADVGMAIWYANILSGLSTQVLNISANFAETLGEVYTAAVMNPKQAGWIFKGLFNGWGRGLLESMDTLQYGHQPTKFQAKVNAAPVLERITFKGGKWNPYNYLKYVSRIMNAADIFFYQGINEMRARELAVAMAKKQGKNQPSRDIIKKATEIIYKGENPFQEALDQAKAEGFSGRDLKRRAYEIQEQQRPEFVVKDSNDEASRGTFNYEPEGTLGAATAGINYLIDKVNIAGVRPLKFIIPFTRIISNVTNRYLDWTPVGLIRAAKGGIGFESLGETYHRKYSPQERAEVAVRAITGISGFIAMMALTDEEDGVFEITANGTGDVQKNFELQETGWRPYSIRIGDTWYEYKNTPLAIPFAILGYMRDAEKYKGDKDLEAKVSIVLFGTMKYVMDLSFLQALSSFMDTFSKDKPGGAENFFKKSSKAVESTVKSFIVPNAFTQVSRTVQEVMDLPIKKANDAGDQIIRDMPILRDHLGNIYDALGDPVVPNQTERFIPLKPSRRTEDTEKIWDLIVKNNAWIGKPRRSTQKPNGDTLTDEEYDKYALLSGQLTKKSLQLEYRYLSRLKSAEEVKDQIDNLKSKARVEAKEILFGF